MNGVLRRGGEAGETLVELLVALSILGVAGVAILAGLELSVKSSALGREQANGGTYVRSLAEAVQDSVTASGGYKNCAVPNSYLTSAVKSRAGIPSQYTVAQTSALSWNGMVWAPCGTDNGSQQVTLTVTSPGTGAHQATEKLTVVLRQPCSGAVPTVGNQTAKPC